MDHPWQIYRRQLVGEGGTVVSRDSINHLMQAHSELLLTNSNSNTIIIHHTITSSSIIRIEGLVMEVLRQKIVLIVSNPSIDSNKSHQ